MNKKTNSQGYARGYAHGYARILDAAAGDHVPQDLNLAPQILARVQKGKGVPMQPRTKLISAVLVVLTALVVLFFSVPAVAAAIQRWFGYVPGIGLVSEGQMRVLAEPAVVTRDGITVTVEQALLNHERTSLVYTVEGIPESAITTKPEEFCGYRVDLRLPDGSRVPQGQNAWNGSESWNSGYEHHFNYQPIPASVSEATLEISCLFPTRSGAAPENWQIPLRFVPAPPDMTAFPVIEIATPTAQPTQAPLPSDAAAPSQTAPAEASGTPDASPADAISLTLDRAVQMDDGYLLYATIHWENTTYDMVDVGPMRLLDASGKELTIEFPYDEQTGPFAERRQTVIAIKTEPIAEPGPLTFQMDGVSVHAPVTQDVTFTFDPGKDPKPGQVWRIDQVLQVGEHKLNVHTARAMETGYVYELSSETGIMYAMLADFDHPVVAGGGGGGGGELGQKFESGFYYESLVAEPITVHVTGVVMDLKLPMSVTWTPPAASPKQLPTQSAACLTAETWKAAVSKQGAALPEGIGGKLILSGPLDSDPGQWGAWITNLDAAALHKAEKQVIPGAQDGVFSPDGSRLAFSTLNDGIRIMDLASGQVAQLPGTAGGDFNPHWTPDGSQIVFNRGMGIFDLFITDLDGANQRKLTDHPGQEWFSGWLADGQMLYQLPGKVHESTTYRLNLQTSEREVFAQANTSAISPDGQYMLNEEWVFGDRWLTYLSRVGGSERTLLASDDLWMLSPIWSPDGQYILAAVSDTTTDDTTGALINPRTCEVIALPGLKGNFWGWAK